MHLLETIAVIDANPTNFQSEVIEASHDRPVLVDFSAAWSEPCGLLGPVLEKLEAAAAGAVKLVRVDADDHPALMQAWSVRSLPTVLVFQGGRLADRLVGLRSESDLRTALARLAPEPDVDLLARAHALLSHGDLPRAAETMRTVLALNPSLDSVRADYVRTLLRLGDAARARPAFEPLRGRARGDAALAALGVVLDAADAVADVADATPLERAVEADPADPAARLRLGQWLLARGRWQAAMDALLEVHRLDRRHADEAGRRGLLAAFALCDDAALVRDYRRRLSAGLN
jgi:putative thioredoxin